MKIYCKLFFFVSFMLLLLVIPIYAGAQESSLGITLDTTNKEVTTVLHGADETNQLVGKLTSKNGKRAIVLKSGAKEKTIARSAWNLPAVGAVNEKGRILICWNTLRGRENPRGTFPDPVIRNYIKCRQGFLLKLKFRRTLTAARSAWLRDIELNENGEFVLSYYKTQSGDLFGSAEPGDGLYTRVFKRSRFLRPELQDS